jgi:hypothetical protein
MMESWLDALPAGGRGSGLDVPVSPSGRGSGTRSRASSSSAGDDGGGRRSLRDSPRWGDLAAAGRGGGFVSPRTAEGGRGMRAGRGEADEMGGWLGSLFVPTGQTAVGRGREGRGRASPALQSIVGAAAGGRGRKLSDGQGEAHPPSFVLDVDVSAPSHVSKVDVVQKFNEARKKEKETVPVSRRRTVTKLMKPSADVMSTLPVFVVFPPFLGIELQTVQIPALMTVAKAMEFLVQLHGGSFSALGMGLCVRPQEYPFDDSFHRSESFPFLEPSKRLQWYEEVITTVPLYWERAPGGGVDETLASPRMAEDSAAQTRKRREELLKRFEEGDNIRLMSVAFPASLGVPPVKVQLADLMSITDAETQIFNTVLKRNGVELSGLHLCIPVEQQANPKVNAEILRLGLREDPHFPYLGKGTLLKEYATILDLLDYVEMSAPDVSLF